MSNRLATFLGVLVGVSAAIRRKAHHICVLDTKCWRDWWDYGMPLRIYWGTHSTTLVSGDISDFLNRREWKEIVEQDPLGRWVEGSSFWR